MLIEKVMKYMYSILECDLTKPALLVVPTNGTLYNLIESINNECLPTIDVEIVLSLTIDALIHKQSMGDDVSLLVKNLFELDENICYCLKRDRDKIPISVLKKTTNALIALIDTVHHSLIKSNLYSGDFLHYEFARIADNDNLLLRRVGG